MQVVGSVNLLKALAMAPDSHVEESMERGAGGRLTRFPGVVLD